MGGGAHGDGAHRRASVLPVSAMPGTRQPSYEEMRGPILEAAGGVVPLAVPAVIHDLRARTAKARELLETANAMLTAGQYFPSLVLEEWLAEAKVFLAMEAEIARLEAIEAKP